MRTLRATPQGTTHKAPNYLMMGHEVRLSTDLLVDYPHQTHLTVEEYATKLQEEL